MGAFYTPDIPYDLNTWLDNLGAYSIDPGLFASLDSAREIINSQKYYWLGVPFPRISDVLITGLDTFSGNITVPPLSYVMAITGDAFKPGEDEEPGQRSLEGFQLRLYDKGAKMDTIINSQFANNGNFVGLEANIVSPNIQTNRPIGPLFPSSPMVILEPGSLQIEITNLNTSACIIQVLISLCVPVNRKSANETIVQQGG